jgi:hypothetical protein
MRSPSSGGWSAALIAAATLAGLLAGCAGASNGAVLTAAHPRNLGPVAGSRGLAAASARRLLGLLTLPAGSQQLPARPVPRALEQPGLYSGGPGNFFDQDRFYRLPMAVTEAIAFLRVHVPQGTVSSSSSGAASSDGVTITAIAATQRRVPAGIDQINLVETLTPGPVGSSLLRADAQVVWYPPRSAAEYLIASRFRSVRITVTGSTRTTTVTGGQQLIRPLAAVLDSMHATPSLLLPCPIGGSGYELAFAPAVRAQRAVVVQNGPCNADTVSVDGRPQPELFDTGRLSALVTRLLAEHTPAHRGR